MYTENEYKNRIFNEDSLEGLKKLPDNCIDCCVTSPPYYALRDYGVDGQIGLEETPERYIDKLTDVFNEVKRVLKTDGTLWLNIGDSYWGGGWRNASFNEHSGDIQKGSKGTYCGETMPNLKGNNGVYKDKDLIGIPWMLAFSLRANGWYLRQDIIWHKPNPMPESVKDRCTKSHEYIFLMSKSNKYYFDSDAICEIAAGCDGRKDVVKHGSIKYAEKNILPNGKIQGMAVNEHQRWRFKNLQEDGQSPNTMHIKRAFGNSDVQYPLRNKRDVWSVNTKPDNVAHFATYPEDLIKPCILAGSRRCGYVLDPFMGSGTTAMVARKLNRNFVGFELNRDYIKICEEKIKVTPDLFY